MMLAQEQTNISKDRILIPDIILYKHSYLILAKCPKMYIGENSSYNKWYSETWISTCRKINLGLYLYTYKTLNSKQIKEFNIGLDILIILEVGIMLLKFDL